MGNLIFNFTGLYEAMKLKFDGARMLDFTGLSGSELYVDENAERIISAEIKKYGADGIHLLDNGNYHYITRLFLNELGEPFDLLYFDNHSDDQTPAFEGLKSCGSWVLDTKRELPDRLGGTVWVDGNGIVHRNGEMSKTRALYISVDKDVFGKDIALTNWDQGNLAMNAFRKIVREMTAGRRIAGIDICGECVSRDGIFEDKELELNRETDIVLIGFLEGLLYDCN